MKDMISAKDLADMLLSQEFKAFLPEILETWSKDPEIKPCLNTILITWSQEPEVQEFLALNFDINCATSELELLRRHNMSEDNIETLQAENAALKERVAALETITRPARTRLSTEFIEDVPSTVTDIRADHLMRYMETNPNVPEVDGGNDVKFKYLNTKTFKEFVTTVLPEKLRPLSYKNIRKLKKDVFENAAARYENRAAIDKSKHGNKETRLVFIKDIPLQEET